MVHVGGLLQHFSPQALLNLNRSAGRSGVNPALTLTTISLRPVRQPAQIIRARPDRLFRLSVATAPVSSKINLGKSIVHLLQHLQYFFTGILICHEIALLKTTSGVTSHDA
jgi:hypothetical protein